MNEKLEYCPFCGSKDVELRAGAIFNGAVHCNDCTADVVFNAVGLIKDGGDWREIMTKGWNRRANNAE